MASNTPVPMRAYGSTTAELAARSGVAKQLVVDTTKNTLVVMDGSTAGGHPLAKESLKIRAGSPNIKINGGEEANLGGDIVITLLPGYVPTGFAFVDNPAGQEPGKYLVINYTDTDGSAKSYYVPAAVLSSNYTAGDGVEISGTNVITVKLGAGLTFADGKVTIDWEAIVDPDSFLTVKDGLLSTKSIVSADEDNILAVGSDGGVFMPGDLGDL